MSKKKKEREYRLLTSEMTESITSVPMPIKWVITKCYKQSTPTTDNLDIVHQFLKRYNWPKFTQEEIDNLNGSISISKLESVINNFLQQEKTMPTRVHW